MERGIVMEVKKQKAVILKPDGTFEKITFPKGKNPIIGEELLIPNVETKSNPSWSIHLFPKVALAAMMLLVTVLATQFYPLLSTSNKVMAIISVDINPSIEVSINEDMQVLSIKMLNDDASELITDPKKYEQMNVQDFMANILAIAKEKGYLNTNKDVLIATTVVESPNDKNFENNLMEQVTNIPDTAQMQVTYVHAEKKALDEAKGKGLSLGRYIALVEANKKGNKLTLNDAKTKPVKLLKEELKDRIALLEKLKKEKQEQEKADRENEGNNKEKDNNKDKSKDKDKSDNEENEDSDESEGQTPLFNCTTLSTLLQLTEEQEEFFKEYCEDENENDEKDKEKKDKKKGKNEEEGSDPVNGTVGDSSDSDEQDDRDEDQDESDHEEDEDEEDEDEEDKENKEDKDDRDEREED